MAGIRRLFEANRFRELLFGLEPKSWVARSALHGVRVGYLTYREFLRDFCWERAAALTFTTIVSLLPIAVLTLSVFGLFVEDAELQRSVDNFVDERLDQVFPPADSEAPPFYLAAATADEKVDPEEIRGLLHTWVGRYATGANFRVDVMNNLVAIGTLVLASLALLVSVERVFNRIWNVPGTRNYFQRFVTFWMILTTSPLLVALNFYVDSLTGEGTDIRQLMEEFGVVDFFYGLAVPAAISCAAFTVANLFLPKARVRFFPAVIGGSFSGLLWLALKANFYLYIGRAIEMRSFYGSLAVVPIFLFFLYLTWLITLAGGELSFAVQNYRRLARAQTATARARRFSAPFAGLVVLERLLKHFSRESEPPRAEALVPELDLSNEELEPILAALLESHVLAESAGGGWTFASDPASVSLDRVVERLSALDFRDETSEPLTEDLSVRAHARARDAYLATFRGKTVADLRPPQGPVLAPEPGRLSPESR